MSQHRREGFHTFQRALNRKRDIYLHAYNSIQKYNMADVIKSYQESFQRSIHCMFTFGSNNRYILLKKPGIVFDFLLLQPLREESGELQREPGVCPGGGQKGCGGPDGNLADRATSDCPGRGGSGPLRRAPNPRRRWILVLTI